MNRKFRTNVPSSREARKLNVPDRELVVERQKEQRRKQKVNFDQRHRAQDLLPQHFLEIWYEYQTGENREL